MLYIHIGFRKTGSTTIQRFVSTNREILLSHNLDYPKVGRTGRAHFNLVYDIKKHPMFRPESGGLGDLKRYMEERPRQNYLISSESFHRLKPKSVQDLARSLSKMQVKVIGYIRPLTSLIVSWYMQNVKMGYYTEDFDRFFEDRAAFAEADADQIGEEVYQQIASWGEVFGWEALHIRALDKRHLREGDLLKDFTDAVDLDWDQLDGAAQETEARNVSPGWKAVELMRVLHAAAGKLPSRRDPEAYLVARDDAWAAHSLAEKVAAELGLNQDRGLYLTQSQAEICDGAYRKLVEKLNERLTGPPIPQPDSRVVEPRPFLPEANRVPQAQRAAFFERMALGLAEELRRVSEQAGAPSPAAEADKASRQEARKQERRAARQAEKRARKQEAGGELSGGAAAP